MLSPRLVTLTVLTLCLLADPTPARAEDPSPHRRQEIADAITQLGSADPAEREAATRVLWAAGAEAEAALREAAAGDNPEEARRATEILRNLRYGIGPDTPPAIVDLLAQYRQAERDPNPQALQQIVRNLASRGAAGLRVLSRLWQDEPDAARRRLLAQALAERARPAAALLLAEHATDAAVAVLEAAAEAGPPWGEPATRDLAALLLLRDKGAGLDEQIARLKPLVADASAVPADRARSARRLAYFTRARGDLTAARWAAEQANEAALAESLLIESGDWEEMARRFAARGEAIGESVEDLGFAAAYHRLAGDAAGLDRFASQTVALAERKPAEAILAAESLFLNDRPDAGVEVLLRHKAYEEVAEVLAPRMKFDALVGLARQLRDAGEAGTLPVEARAAAVRHLLGDTRGAREDLGHLMDAADGAGDFARYARLAEAAAAIGEPQLAEDCALRGLTIARPIDDVAELLEEAGFAPGDRAAWWWRVLRDKYKEPPRITFGRLRALLRGELPAAQCEQLARAAAEDVLRAQTADRDAALGQIGDTLLGVGHRDAAHSFFRWIVDRRGQPPVALAFVRLADLEGEAGRWDNAAGLYSRAWELDRTQPLPLLLRGAALAHLNRAEEGRAAVETAHLLPLGDDAARHALMVELDRRQMRDDARRERDAIVRTSTFQSWYLSDALRRAGDEAYEKEDYLAAAALWDRAFLDNQSRGTRFAKLWANFAMPALIHRARALGLMRAGDLAGANREADLALHYSPSDTDALIAFVNELDKLGKKAEADALYRKHAAPYRALCEAHPASGQAHNQLAWAAAKCRRDLDDALKHALRAVELEPKNTASLDTLAETYFQRGQVQLAVETMNKCVELEPNEKRHREQLARFTKGLTR
jgi:tetratricopeptide (TPR) repeat protein